MRIEYVFIRKENATTKITDKISTTNPPLHLVLRKIFTNVSDDTITIKYKKKEYAISYQYVEHACEKVESDAEMHSLTIELEGKNKARIAEVLDTVHRSIFNHDEKKNYDIIVSYDGISKYYCDRAYPLLNEFERQIRNLIFKLLTRSFGALWLKKTATQEQQDSLKAKLQIKSKSLRNQRMIEEALYEMDIKELENYLFLPRSDMSITELRTDEFTKEKLSELSQKSAIELIQKLRPTSIWERYFDKEVSIPNLQEKLDSIRNYRNKVAHAKHFHKDDYNACKDILDEMLPQLEIAIQDISVQEYNTAQVQEAIRGIADTCTSAIKSAMSIGRALSPAIENLGRAIAEIGDLFQSSVVSQTLQAQNQMSQTLLGLSSVLSALPSQSVIQTALQAQQFIPPSSVLETINTTSKALLPVASMMKSMELASKALLPPDVIAAYQNAIPVIQKPEFLKFTEIASQITPSCLSALSSTMRTSQMIEQMTRFQNIGNIKDYDADDSFENDSDQSTDDKEAPSGKDIK